VIAAKRSHLEKPPFWLAKAGEARDRNKDLLLSQLLCVLHLRQTSPSLPAESWTPRRSSGLTGAESGIGDGVEAEVQTGELARENAVHDHDANTSTKYVADGTFRS
jgi:hypothetical protein